MQSSALTRESDYVAPNSAESLAVDSMHTAPTFAPFVIGVTGHRHLTEVDLDRARSAVTEFLVALRRLLPDTQLTVMLGMTAGGDLVIAEAALALGIHVRAVLPLPLAEFVEDFDDRNRRLLAHLLAHKLLSCTELPQSTHRSSPYDAVVWRQAAYRKLTDVLIRKSNLLLAVWDGKASQRQGGTTDTVLRWLRVRTDATAKSQLEFTLADADADAESPFLYWLPSDHGMPSDSLAAASPCYLTGLGDTIRQYGSRPPEALQRQLKEFNDYNRDFRRIVADSGAPQDDMLLAGVPPDLLGGDRQRLLEINAEYAKADALALHYQKRSDRLFGMFGVFAFVMGFLYLIYDKLGENQYVLMAYLIILLGSLALYPLLYTKIWFVKHLSYRAAAETLRVTFYLCLAGVARSVDAAEILALSGIQHFDGFGWLGYVLKNVAPMNAATAPLLDPNRSEFVRNAWVEDQHRYFSRKIRQLERRSRKVSQWQKAVVVVTVLVLLARMLFSQPLRTMYVSSDVPLKNVLMLVAGVTALFLGAWKLHQSKMATRELIWQYKNQLAAFSRSSAELARTATPDRRTEILVELGRRSLMESYLWTIHRYHREHAPPAG